jgi:hypothetical protein
MPRHRLEDVKVRFLSLCPKGANRLPVIIKDDGSVEFETVCKVATDFEKSGLMTSIVYAPNVDDSQGDFATREEIVKMAHDAMLHGVPAIDINHDFKALPKEDARVVESFIIAKGDPRFADVKDYSGKAVDTEGAWAVVIKIEKSDLRAKYLSGEWKGVSLGGTGKRVPVAKKEDIEMDKAELIKLLDERDAAKEAALKKATETAAATPTSAAPAAPVLKSSDMGNPDAVAKYHMALKRHNLSKSVTDWNDTEQVGSYLTELKKFDVENPTVAPSGKQAPAPSNQVSTVTKTAEADSETKLAKTMAEIANRSLGVETK